MSITIAGYEFQGPYTSTSYLKDDPGVYVILCDSRSQYNPVDVGEAEEVKERVENHDRESCWNRNCFSSLVYAVRYVSGGREARREIERKIRNTYDFPCGEW